ncbi:hypothetical protein KQI89_08735 [Clostridium sp. MSJ-4]|uniref:Uncharacterized protein n=1 Tax=Clostridium simiarum TaxID=2841506 RepID=A0ABS6F0D6_9CLOT|nr:hypothetical protein [Clostridium simiarum]MBU5591850.1 hypothetical protein [Clostridium simiarum]
MKIKPSIIITDLQEYVNIFNISLTEEAIKTLMDVENFAYKCNNPANFKLFFSKIIRNSKVIQNILVDKGTNPNLIALILEKDYYESIDELATYEKDSEVYSKVYQRKNCEKTAIIDSALEYCTRDYRNMLENTDIILAAMDEYERILEQDGGQWVDKELNKGVNTLSHVYGRYDKSLWVKFDDIREGLLRIKKIDKYNKAS